MIEKYLFKRLVLQGLLALEHRNEGRVHGIVVLRNPFAAALITTAVIPVFGEDVHVCVWRVEFVEQVVHLEIKFKIVFTTFVVAFA